MEYRWQWYRIEPFFYRVIEEEIIVEGFALPPPEERFVAFAARASYGKNNDHRIRAVELKTEATQLRELSSRLEAATAAQAELSEAHSKLTQEHRSLSEASASQRTHPHVFALVKRASFLKAGLRPGITS